MPTCNICPAVAEPTAISVVGSKSLAVICPNADDLRGVLAVSVAELSIAPDELTDKYGASAVRLSSPPTVKKSTVVPVDATFKNCPAVPSVKGYLSVTETSPLVSLAKILFAVSVAPANLTVPSASGKVIVLFAVGFPVSFTP